MTDPHPGDDWSAAFAAVCPYCGYKTDSTTAVSDGARPDARPTPGMVSLCIRCYKFAIFTPLGLRLPTDREAIEISPQVAQLQMIMRLRLGRTAP